MGRETHPSSSSAAASVTGRGMTIEELGTETHAEFSLSAAASATGREMTIEDLREETHQKFLVMDAIGATAVPGWSSQGGREEILLLVNWSVGGP